MEPEKLNRSQVLKELQTHTKYASKTQKEISDKLGGINNLRIELSRLKNKKTKTNDPEVLNSVEILPNNFIGVKDVDLKLLHGLAAKELYNICQSNKYMYNICQNDKILKQRVQKIFKFIQFPMISETYHFVNFPNVNIKKNIKFNKEKYDLLHQINPSYCNVDGITIYLTNYKEQYFTEKIVIDEPIQLTLIDIIQLIINEFNKPDLNTKFMKKYKKGAILMGMEYKNNGYYLILDRYL